MTSQAKELLSAALRLPSADREALAQRLLDSLENDDPDAEAAWRTEIEQRVRDLEGGNV